VAPCVFAVSRSLAAAALLIEAPKKAPVPTKISNAGHVRAKPRRISLTGILRSKCSVQAIAIIKPQIASTPSQAPRTVARTTRCRDSAASLVELRSISLGAFSMRSPAVLSPA
jgi:hypothetical protein